MIWFANASRKKERRSRTRCGEGESYMKDIASKSSRTSQVGGLTRRGASYLRGQLSVLFALAMVTLVGVMALGADVGVLYYNWGQLQKAADAAALAGANSLPNDPTTAVANAKTYAVANGVKSSEVTATAIPTINPTQVQVVIQRTVPYSFARVLGLTDGLVKVSAIAAPPPGICTANAGPSAPISCGGTDCTSGGTTLMAGSCTPPGSTPAASGAPFPGGCGTSTGQYNILPIAVDNKTANSFVANSTYTLNRMDANGANGPWVDAPGNWGFIDICGSTGGSALRSSIANGYYGELTIGNTLTTQPGVSNGNVAKGLNGLLDRAASYKSTPTATDFNNPPDPRAVIVPLVNFAGATGKSNVQITGFMAFYINSVNTSSTNVNGVNGEITGTFIDMVDPNSTPSINAPNLGAMGDVVLLK